MFRKFDLFAESVSPLSIDPIDFVSCIERSIDSTLVLVLVDSIDVVENDLEIENIDQSVKNTRVFC